MAFDFSTGILGEELTPEQNKMMMLGLLSNAFTNLGNLGAGRPQESPMYGLLSMQSMFDQRNQKSRADKARQKDMQAAMKPAVPAIPAQPAVPAQTVYKPAPSNDPLLNNSPLMSYMDYSPEMLPEQTPEIPAVPGRDAQPGGFDANAYYQAALMNPDNPDRDMAFKAMLEQQKADKTAEMKNWEYGMSLPEEQRQQFFARAGSGSSPSAVQEWEFFNRLDPQHQARYLEMKRNPQIMNLGGAMAVRAPGGGIVESYAVTPKQEDMPSFRGAQAAAVEGAKTQVQTEADAVNKGKNADSLISNIDEAERILKARKATGSLLGAGLAAGKGVVGVSDASTQANQQLELISGWMVANVPRMEGPQSNYDVQNYRVMAAMVGDKTKPIEDRLAALRTLRKLQEKYKSIRSGQPTRPPIDSLWGN